MLKVKKLYIHSFIRTISIAPLQVQKRSRHSTDAVPEFHAEAPHATASEGHLGSGELEEAL